MIIHCGCWIMGHVLDQTFPCTRTERDGGQKQKQVALMYYNVIPSFPLLERDPKGLRCVCVCVMFTNPPATAAAAARLRAEPTLKAEVALGCLWLPVASSLALCDCLNYRYMCTHTLKRRVSIITQYTQSSYCITVSRIK